MKSCPNSLPQNFGNVRNLARSIILAITGGLGQIFLALPLYAQITPTTFTEQYKAIKAPGAVAKLGPDVFGDNVNLYTGGLDFTQTDVNLRGNSALAVSLGRRLQTGRRGFDDRPFGRWDLDIPHLYGTFAKGNVGNLQGWKGRDGSNARCSQFGAPPEADGLQSSSLWAAEEFWQGNHMYIPGGGEHRLLRRDPAYTKSPSAMTIDGVTVSSFPVVTSTKWSLGCWPSLRSDTTSGKTMGEGFLAVSPDGTRYKFDWMVTFQATTLTKTQVVPMSVATAEKIQRASDETSSMSRAAVEEAPTSLLAGKPTLARVEVWILPSKAIDRFGNTVTYTYDPARPANLMRIESSDGRILTLTYEIVSGVTTQRIKTVSDGTRTWNYSYHVANGLTNLDRVTLPDSSLWNFANADGLLEELQYMNEPSYCGEHKYPLNTIRSGSMVHPSGATSSFTLTPTEHGRSDVQYWCMDKTLITPIFYHTNSLTNKTISGPGLSPQQWNYAYGPGNGSFSPCGTGCVKTKTVNVTDPKGHVTRYTFGNQYVVSEGKLQQTDVDWNGSSALRSTIVSYHPSTAGNPYPATAGTSDELTGDGDTDMRFYPEDQRTITQQGVTFTWRVDAFDDFVRPTTVTRFSSIGIPQTETTVYADKLPIWVLGLVTNVNVALGNGNLIENTYNANGTLASVKKFGVLQQALTYYPDGTLNTLADGKGQTTTYSNFRAGVPQSIAYPNGTSESAVLNSIGYILSTTDAANFKTTYSYDALGRVQLITPPAPGGTVIWNPTQVDFAQINYAEYDLPAAHWRQDITTGNARVRTYYDALWRPVYTEKWDAADVTGTMSALKRLYDVDGRVTYESYPKSSVGAISEGINQDFDALGRPTVKSASSELGILYDVNDYGYGFVKSQTNARNITTQTSYQVFDQPSEDAIIGVIAPEGVSMSMARDILGKPISITRSGNGKSATRSYVYESNSQRLCKTIEPETGATIQHYDLAGNVDWRASGLALPATNVCDLESVPEAKKMSFAFDTLNRLTTTTFGDGSPAITRTYTADSLPLTSSSNGATWTYGYNSLRNNDTESLNYGGFTYNISRVYDANGSLSQLTYPDGSAVSYNPNALGKPRQVGGYAAGITYHPNGAVKSFTYGNGKVRSLTQNLRGLPETASDTGALNDSYSYDQNGNVAAIADQLSGVNSRTMGYDALDRLTSVAAPALWGAASYSYDALDNLTGNTITTGATARSVALSYPDPATNRLMGVSGSAGYNFSYAYDSQGNIVQRGGQQYTFDQANRLTSASGIATYSYDGLGRRVSVVGTDGVNRVQVYSQAGQILQAGPSGGSATKYIYLNNHVLAEVSSAGTQYQHTDALGSPVARSGATGALVSQTRYEPYGKTAQGATPTLGFTGHVNDADTGLVYMQQRYYDPVAGRFLSIDPVTTDANTGGSFNRYAYGNNNPYGYIDPDGRQAMSPTVFMLPNGLPKAKDVPGVQSVGAAKDFVKNYQAMRDANTIGADKFFHCKANCEASQRGAEGKAAATVISDTREFVDQNVKGDPKSASDADQAANAFGRAQGSNSSQACSTSCSPLAPRGLPVPPPPPPAPAPPKVEPKEK